VNDSSTKPRRTWAALEPLRETSFRRIWSASLLSNFGQLILGVGAAWEMTRLTTAPEMVALVQSALMLPLMLVAVPAGAIADMFDRRKIAMSGLTFAAVSAATLAVLAALGWMSPWLLLTFCFLIGAGVALYAPAWQASVIEQVRPETLPAAVALSSVSYNIARSFGPALGGVLVVAVGAMATFALNALFYLPLLLAFWLWRRPQVSPRLPPENMHRAIVSGARYALHSEPLRNVIVRAFVSGFAGASVLALTPLVARDLLDGDASTYGLLLGANGVGAVAGAFAVGTIREKLQPEHSAWICATLAGLMIAVLGLSHSLALSAAALLMVGGTYMLLVTLLSVGVQLSAPRWVVARALSWVPVGADRRHRHRRLVLGCGHRGVGPEHGDGRIRCGADADAAGRAAAADAAGLACRHRTGRAEQRAGGRPAADPAQRSGRDRDRLPRRARRRARVLRGHAEAAARAPAQRRLRLVAVA
jgi:MFS family permease